MKPTVTNYHPLYQTVLFKKPVVPEREATLHHIIPLDIIVVHMESKETDNASDNLSYLSALAWQCLTTQLCFHTTPTRNSQDSVKTKPSSSPLHFHLKYPFTDILHCLVSKLQRNRYIFWYRNYIVHLL